MNDKACKVFLVIFCMLLTWWFVSRDADDKTVSSSKEMIAPELRNSAVLTHKRSRSEVGPSRCSESSAALTPHRPLRKIDASPVPKELATLEFNGIGTLLRGANAGEPAAAISLFKLAYSCSVVGTRGGLPQLFGRNEGQRSNVQCQEVPYALRDMPLDALVPAAQRGSPEAQLIYAHHASDFAKVAAALGPGKTSGRPENILQTAETFGTSAAKQGILEAFELMTMLYASGTFGEKKVEMGYAYSLALGELIPSAENLERSTFLKNNLSAGEVARATLLATGCSASSESANFLTNPFL